MRIAVLGLGYLGATHAACMAELGHEVIGVETDTTRRQMLENRQLPFYEPGLGELIDRHVSNGSFKITESYADAVEFSNVFFIAVGTPQKKGENGADLRYVYSAVDQLVMQLENDATIFGKSTVPVGTTGELRTRVKNGLANRERDLSVEIAWNPEFLREGFAIEDTLHPDRIVIGVDTEGTAANTLREIYAPILENGTPIVMTDTATAELVKVSANAFLATKISFINAIAEVCEAAGADVKAVSEAIGYDARIGRKYLNAGIGFGGGCLPKDIRAFIARSGELGAAEALSFLREVDNINMRRRTRIVDLSRKILGSNFIGARVAVLGAAFKPDSDDVRDSPALNIAGQIQLQGASVTVYDPRAISNSKALFPTLEYASDVDNACLGADLVLVLTEWAEFVQLDPMGLDKLVRQKNIIDGRMCLEQAKWVESGWRYFT